MKQKLHDFELSFIENFTEPMTNINEYILIKMFNK